MVKQRRESIALYRQGNRPELAAQEEEEIAVIESFLPRQMSDDGDRRGGAGRDRRDRRRRAQGHGPGHGGVARAPCRGHRHGQGRRRREAAAGMRRRTAQIPGVPAPPAILAPQRCGLGSCPRGRPAGLADMAFPPGFLDELRSRVALGDLVGRRVRLTRRGREYGGLCPFHNEKTPSFYVVEDKGFFHCFGCGAHGDAIGFVDARRQSRLHRGGRAAGRRSRDRGAAADAAGARAGDSGRRPCSKRSPPPPQFYEAQLWSPAGARAPRIPDAARPRRGNDPPLPPRLGAGRPPVAAPRRSAREFPEALLREAGLLRVPEDGGTPYDYFRGRVMFPIGDRAGRVIAFGGRTLGDDQPKYLNSPDTPLFEKGRVLYAWAAARANIARASARRRAGVIVVEGYMDVIALHRAGFGARGGAARHRA